MTDDEAIKRANQLLTALGKPSYVFRMAQANQRPKDMVARWAREVLKAVDRDH